MNSKASLVLGVLVLFITLATAIPTISSFERLAVEHCDSFPIDLLYRLSTGQLAQVYGAEFRDIDCYVRQFVNKDGQDPFVDDEEEEEEDEQSEEEAEEQIPENDPIAVQYARGLTKCLPEGTDAVEAVYAIWRFYRFIVQHDYALEWMRAKIRATLGYEAERPSSWMDGEQSAARLRLDKLFSNQFYDYVDKLMFRDFLHPIITFFKKNLVLAVGSQASSSGQPLLLQYIESKNLMSKTFLPILFAHKEAGNIFAYTVPGIPLLLSGTSRQVSWAFTGVLVDRSNIEQIETLGNKFFHHDSQTWIKLSNVTHLIKIKDSQPSQCTYVHSNYGTLYQKHKSLDGGKVSQYIARWHENEKKVRVIFSDLMKLILNQGQSTTKMEFPFNSLVITNSSGIFQYLCMQKHPSYFLYPDLAGAPQYSQERWISNFKRNFLIVSNTHLTTKNQETYLKKEVMNPTEEQFLIDTRRYLSRHKFTLDTLFEFATNLQTDPLIKKRKDLLIYIYRKAKFLFFPDENIRKQCDQIVAMLERWDDKLNSQAITPAFILWDYFFKDYTFNYVSGQPLGAFIAKHKIVTDLYWTNQVELWKVGTSYGECDSTQWHLQMKQKLNGTGDNSTCYFNIMRGINRTREVLRSENGNIKEPVLSDYSQKKILKLREGYLGSHIEEAFSQFYSKNLAFVAEIDNPRVIYLEGWDQQQKEADLSALPETSTEEPQAQSDSQEQVPKRKEEQKKTSEIEPIEPIDEQL